MESTLDRLTHRLIHFGRLIRAIPVWLWAIVYAGIALYFAWKLDPAITPIVADNQHYFYIAERAASGVPPHVSHFDPKHALSMLMSAAAMAVGRWFDVPDIYASRALSMLVGVGSIGSLFVIAERFTGSRLAGHLAACTGLTFNHFIVMSVVSNRPKVFLVGFVCTVLLAVSSRRPVLFGIACAGAFLCWQPALIYAALAPLALLFWQRPVRSLAAFALAFALSVAAYEAYFVYHGALGEQLEQSYTFPSQHMSGVELKARSMYLRFQWLTKTKDEFDLRSVVALVSMVPIALAAFACFLMPIRAWRYLSERPEWFYALGCATAGLVFLHLDYQGFPDRFIVEPLLALSLAVTVSGPMLALAHGTWARRAASAGGLTALMFVGAIPGSLNWKEYRGPELPEQIESAQRIGELLDAGHSVYALGCTHLLAFVHANNWSHYGFFFRGMSDFVAKTYGRPFVPYRDGELPEYIFFTRSKLPGLERWLPRLYRRETPGVAFRNAMELWALRDEPASPAEMREFRQQHSRRANRIEKREREKRRDERRQRRERRDSPDQSK